MRIPQAVSMTHPDFPSYPLGSPVKKGNDSRDETLATGGSRSMFDLEQPTTHVRSRLDSYRVETVSLVDLVKLARN